jgi:hypothetical protein
VLNGTYNLTKSRKARQKPNLYSIKDSPLPKDPSRTGRDDMETNTDYVTSIQMDTNYSRGAAEHGIHQLLILYSKVQ